MSSAETEILRNGLVGFNKSIASEYVKPLLDENILSVTRDHIRIRTMTVPRERVVFLHVALTQLRSPQTQFPITQGRNGFSVEQIKAARGNDVVDAYRITSNAEDHTSIILTRKLAWELWEVIAFFIPTLTEPSDNPLPKSEKPFSAEDIPEAAESDADDDSEDEEEDDGPVTFDYTPFPMDAMKTMGLINVVTPLIHNRHFYTIQASDYRLADDQGNVFVIASSNESEHAEWEEGSEWGNFLMDELIPALHDFSVETYNNDEETLDDESEDFTPTDEDDEVE